MMVHVVTLGNPTAYTPAQLEQAIQLAKALARGRLVLCEPPRG